MEDIINIPIDERYQSERMKWDEKLKLALDIGEQMMLSGAEVSRVEDSIRRICIAFGADRADVLSITTSLIVTIYYEGYGNVTQTRRTSKFAFNMDRLEKMNALSRHICENALSVEEARKEYKEVMAEKPYSFGFQLLFFMLVSFSFSIFFGGTLKDALISALIAIPFKCIDSIAAKTEANSFLTILVSSLLGGFLAIIAVRAGLADSVGKVSIGNVMLLIPGIMLTNSMRDMFGGDTITGGIRFIEAMLIAVTIALGFSIASVFYDGLFDDTVTSAVRNISPELTVAAELITAFFGAFAYASLFNIRKHRIVSAGIGGMIGWAAYLAAGLMIESEAVKFFISAMVITVYAEKMARFKKAPATVFLVSAIMPLVPGGMLYETMSFAVKEEWVNFADKGVDTMSVALALAMGMLTATSALKILRKYKTLREARKKRLEQE